MPKSMPRHTFLVAKVSSPLQELLRAVLSCALIGPITTIKKTKAVIGAFMANDFRLGAKVMIINKMERAK